MRFHPFHAGRLAVLLVAAAAMPLMAHAATTAKIVDRPELTMHSLRQALRDSLEAGGWLDATESAGLADQGVDDLLGLLRRVTASAPAGTLVRRTGELVWFKHPSTIDTPEV